MKRIVFVDVDTQFDFMNPEGNLYVGRAEEIIPNLKDLTRFADRLRIPIVSSLDAHLKDDPEFKVFPAHCVKNTKGAKKIKETIARKTKQIFIPKRTFDLFSHPKAGQILGKFKIAYVYGVALDYCLKAACLGLVSLGVKTYLIKDATKAVSRKSGAETKRILRKKGVIFITTHQLLTRLP